MVHKAVVMSLKSQVFGVNVFKFKGKGMDIAVLNQIISALWEITCHMRSHSITCHPAAVTFPPQPQLKLVLDLATPEGCKAELTWVVVILQVYSRNTVT